MPSNKPVKIEYFTFAASPAEIDLAANDDKGNPRLPTFKMLAYTGTLVNARNFRLPLIIDLTGLEIPKQSIPVRLLHTAEYGVGHTTKIELKGTDVFAEGVISRETEYSKDVVSAAKNGFPWQVSLGGSVQEYQYISPDESVNVNGQIFKGECYVIRKLLLKEVSFVDIGADPNTSASIKFSYDDNNPPNNKKGNKTIMENQQTLNQTTTPIVSDDGVVFKGGGDNPMTLSGQDGNTGGHIGGNTGNDNTGNDAMKQLILENRRIAAITHFGGGQLPDLEAKAIEEGWTVEKFQGEYNNKMMPSASRIAMSGESVGKGLTASALEAIALRAAGSDSRFLEKNYEPQTLELADKYGGIGIQEYCELASGGKYLPKFRRDPHAWLQAAFSSMSLPGVLSGVVNKTLLEGFEIVDNTWKKITAFGTTNDFKKYDRYRLTGDFKFQKVGADGELKHGKVGEEQFSMQVDTHGIMFSLTRKDIINDDLGALSAIPKQIGMGAAYAINDALWGLLLSNPVQKDGKAFFHADHGNLLPDTDLNYDGFGTAKTKFALQEFTKGRPLSIPPKYLLVPTALETQAIVLMTSPVLNGGTVLTGNVNPHYKLAEVISTPYLQAAAFTGNSETTWYLFADPRQMAALEVAFLHGKQHPTVERADADFNTLGIQFRGYMDFGVALQDWRAALKVTA